VKFIGRLRNNNLYLLKIPEMILIVSIKPPDTIG